MAIDFHRLATQDFVQARRWYARYGSWLENRFVHAVQAAVRKIEANPYCGTRLHGQYYWVRTHRFPYLIYYEIIDPTLAKVFAVAHKRRRPGYWTRRTNRP